jgi:hypothetical protein
MPTTRTRRQAIALRRCFRCEQQRARTVVHAGCIACRDRTVGAHDRLEFGERFHRCFARMLVLRYHHRIALALRDSHGRDLVVETARFACGDRLALRGQRHAILRLPIDAIFLRDVLRGFRHRMRAVLLIEPLVDEAPADGRIVNLRMTAERRLGLRHHKGRTAHALHATCDHQFGFARLDGACGTAQRIHTGTTQTVDGRARHVLRQPRQQTRHTRHVTIVFARLIHAAVNHIVDALQIELRMARNQSRERRRAEIVRSYS